MAFQRFAHDLEVTLESTEPATPAIPFGDSGAGIVAIPAGSSITALTFYVNTDKGGTFTQVYDSSNNAVSRTVAASRAYAIPDECFAARWLKIVSNVQGEVEISLKS